MVPGHVLIAAFVLAAFCSCATNPEQPQQTTAHDAHGLRTRLIEGQWKLFSPVYPAITTEGYSIGFEANGRVRTRNLGLTETWRLTEDLTLELVSINGKPTMALPYDSEAGAFVSQPEVGPTFVIGPRGFHFDQFLNNLPAHGDPAR